MRTPSENARLVDQAYREGRTTLECSPSVLTVESTSICNLRCVMCPHGIDAVQRPKHMPENVIEKLSGALAVASDVQLHGIGEPLSSPAFWSALESPALHADCNLNINTNLTLLNDRKLAVLLGVKARLTINVSIDAATDGTYGRIRGAELAEVIDNVEKLIAARGESRRPIVYINMTLMRENIEEAVPFVEMAHRLGVDGVFFYQMNHQPAERMEKYKIDRDGWHFDYTQQGLWNFKDLSNRCLNEALERGRQLGMPLYPEGLTSLLFDDAPATMAGAAPAVSETPSAETVDGAPGQARPEVRDCRAPWEWSLIATNGEVLPCCFGAPPVGNLNDSSFEEIWNGEAMQSLRKSLSENRIPKACEKGLCKYVLNSRLAREEEERQRSELEKAEAERRRGLRGLALAGLDLLRAPIAASRARRSR
ncbi:MAG: radical SAM protein [Reyranellaceae bacterium]